MKTSGRLLLVSILGVVLMAPPAYPQSTNERLNYLMTDMINLKNAVKQLQESSDQKDTEVTRLLQDILARFKAVDENVQKLSSALDGVKTDNQTSARNLQDAKTQLEALGKKVDEGLLSLRNQVSGVTKQINDMQSAEQPLPSPAEAFNLAWGELNQGFYDLAIGDFREFLRNYPNDVRDASAQFYVGEALFTQRKYEQAQIEFDLVLANYPESDKKCSALYRKGQTLAELKQISEARDALQNVTKECPDTQEATNASADLKKLPRR